MTGYTADSYGKLAANVGAFSVLAEYRHLFRLLGFTELADVLEGVPEMAAKAKDVLELPERFNALFLPLGWIAYERLDRPTALKAVQLAETGDRDAGERVLTDYYSTETVRQHLQSLTAIGAFRPRLDLLGLALTDYAEERYHACVPVVLAQLDGVIQDLTEGESFYRNPSKRKIALVAFDSISARSDGLQQLGSLMHQRRDETSSHPLDIPFRNGILHGRELGYGNKKVAAKSWAALFAIRDWSLKKEQRRTDPPMPTPQLSPEQALAEAMAMAARTRRVQEAIDAWQPRQNQPAMSANAPSSLPLGSPERAAAEFANAWLEKDFERMAELCERTLLSREKCPADFIRRLFASDVLESVEILGVVDEAPAASTVRTRMRRKLGGIREVDTVAPLRVIYQDVDGNSLPCTMGGGQWRVLPGSAFWLVQTEPGS